jgi:putative Ca2+/H+ antiporter (TMEM165/GDT1 family)
MDWKLLLTVFGTTFLAELGDKTQLATLSFTCANKHPLTIFLGGSLALICTTLLAVLVGAGLQRVVPVKAMHVIASAAFIVIGVILLAKSLRAG